MDCENCCFSGHRDLSIAQMEIIMPLLKKEIAMAYAKGVKIFYTA